MPESSGTGQRMRLAPTTIMATQPAMPEISPSHVLLGETLISFVLPHRFPPKYAAMSAATIEIIVHHCTIAPCVNIVCPSPLRSRAASGHAAHTAWSSNAGAPQLWGGLRRAAAAAA